MPVTHHQVHVHGHGKNEHQRNEIGRYHRNRPADKAQQSHHDDHCKAATAQGQQNETGLPENDRQHDHQEGEHPGAEYHQVVLDEGDHIVRDHGNAAQVECPFIPVTLHHRTGCGHGFVIAPGSLLLDFLIAVQGVCKLLLFRCSQSLCVLFDQQFVSSLLRIGQDNLVFQVDLQRRGPGILADQQVKEDGAGQQFLPCSIPVNVRVFQGAVVCGNLGQCAADDFHQRRVEQRKHRSDGRNLLQVFPQRMDGLKRRIREQVRVGSERHDQELLGFVPFVHLAQYAQVLVAFQDQGIGGGVQFEVPGMPGKKSEYGEQYRQHQPGPAEDVPIVESSDPVNQHVIQFNHFPCHAKLAGSPRKEVRKCTDC